MLLSLTLCLGGLATPFQESGAVPQAEPAEARPNILFILADDFGWMDAGFQNAETFYDTPNLDRLRAGGVQMTAAYAACPVCSPTRASILTGRHPARIDTTDWFGAPQPDGILKAGREGGKRRGRFQKLPLLPAPYIDHLPQEEVTLPEVLKGAGYATFFAGKWHLGGDGFEPETQGFDINVAGHQRGGPYGPGRYFHPFGMPNLESKEGEHLPARLAEEASKFIETERDDPWLCYLSFYSVHTPLMGRKDLVAKYKKKRDALGLEPEWGKEGERKVRLTQEHAVYAAMVAAMDEAVGEVLDALDRSGQADNTMVVFFSDNGGLSTSEGHPTSNLPLRGGKGWLYEGGVREPCAVRWPGQIPAGATSDLPIQSVDFLPTLLAAAGVAAPEGVELDGVDLLPVLRAPASEPETALATRRLYWHYPHYGNQGGFPGGAVRQGRWKWIERYGDGGELYDLNKDVGEVDECSAEHPEIARELAADLAAWRISVGAKMPVPNPLLDEPSDD
ncbi:MAG: arylsulfatase A-like enzyme [Planctomycetota bacterium]|jgi:arylsulfatase A-like enzyme